MAVVPQRSVTLLIGVWGEETLARFEDTVQYAGGMDQLTAIGRKDLHAPHMRGSAPMQQTRFAAHHIALHSTCHVVAAHLHSYLYLSLFQQYGGAKAGERFRKC